MLILVFILLAGLVVFFTTRLVKQADSIEKNTTLNVIFIGILLAIATSLPELSSGITAVYRGEPEITISNIFGSNIFNLLILAFVNIMFYKDVIYSKINNDIVKINFFVLCMYVVYIIGILIATFTDLISITRFNYTSLILIVIYIVAIKFISKSEGEKEEEKFDKNFNVNKTFIKFGFFSLLVLIFAILMTLVAEEIMYFYGLSASFVGAILIGITTSLPELTSALTLVKKKSYNLAFSSVLSSNLFNFMILVIVDILSPNPLTQPLSLGMVILLSAGIMFLILTTVAIYCKFKNKFINLIIPLLMLLLYGSLILRSFIK